jgi:hypothetical protein
MAKIIQIKNPRFSPSNLLPRLSRHNQMVSRKFVNPLQILLRGYFFVQTTGNKSYRIISEWGRKKKRLSDDIFPTPLKGQKKKSVNEWRHYFSI